MSEAEAMEEKPERDSKPEAGLEGKLAAKEEVSNDIDDNGRVYPTYNGERAKSSKANYSASDAPSRHTGKSTDNGAVAFIYNEETGEVAFEQKFPEYSNKSERGKLQCIGGHVDEGENSLEALIREIEEETVNSSDVINALKEKGYYYHTQTAEFDGKNVSTDYFVIPLSNSKWKKFVEGGLKGEATGPLRTLPLNQAYDLGNDFYAFKSGPIVKEIMGRIQPSCVQSCAPHGSHSLEAITSGPFKSAMYSGSITPPYAQSVSVNPMPMQSNYFIRTITNNYSK